MTTLGDGLPVAQHNHGPGTFVGGHVFGNVEVMDETTKVAIADVSVKMPDLAFKLSTALEQGLISPEVVSEIADATRHINEEVASWIWEGGRHINEDVASWLLEAGRNINGDVANRFSQIVTELRTAASSFDEVVTELNSSSRTLRSARANASEWERTAVAMDHAAQELAMALQMQAQDQRRFSKDSFLAGLGVGVFMSVLLAILVLVIQAKIH